MNYRNLFIFVIDHLKQRSETGRGVIIVRSTPLEEVVKQMEAFFAEQETKDKIGSYRKDTSPEHPEMVIFIAPNNKEHIVVGRSEQGWKGDYGLTHDDVIVSVL
jgi:hypothetical protein